MRSVGELRRWLGSGMLAATVSWLGIGTAEQVEKRMVGGKAVSVRGLIARHTLMAATFSRMKRHKGK